MGTPPTEGAATIGIMTHDLFRADAYLRECEARIVRIDDAGLVLDRTVFYPLGGGRRDVLGWA